MRNNEITNIRAIGTIMVLLGHCLYAFAGLDWVFNVPYSEMASGLTRYIYSFHMGLFFIVSGLLFQKVYVKRIDKVNAFTFVNRRFVRLIIPLITVKFLICNPVNIYIGRYNPWNCKSFFIELGHLWFLLTLFVISSGLYIVMYNLKRNRIGGGTHLTSL